MTSRIVAIGLGVAMTFGLALPGVAGASVVSSTKPTPPAGQPTASKAFAAFEACLKSKGVTMTFGVGRGGKPPSGSSSGGSSSGGSAQGGAGGQPKLTPKQQAAFTSCRSKLPKQAFGGRGFGGGGGFTNSAAFAAYRNCLSEHGYQLPNFRPGQGGSTSTTRPVLTPKDTAAMTACAPLRPKGFTGHAPSGASSGSQSG
jgi:hypothetical protein